MKFAAGGSPVILSPSALFKTGSPMDLCFMLPAEVLRLRNRPAFDSLRRFITQRGTTMTDEEAFEQYGDEPLHFSHYYNFVFIYKSKEMDNGDRIYLQMGGTMEKVSAMSVDVEEHLTLNNDADREFAYIKNDANQVIWKHGEKK
jgi:hypothetical protein